MAHRKHEEGKRKAFEERMMRKAKREGKESGYYLSIGTVHGAVVVVVVVVVVAMSRLVLNVLVIFTNHHCFLHPLIICP